MKVYVDELPKSCIDCPCFEYNEYWDKCYCSGRGEIEDKYKKRQDCHLLSIADYTKQVRKEVCEEIKEYMENHSHTIPVDTKNRKVVYKIGLTRFLDRIQGETK